jgi:hypothetical protein
MNQMNINTLVYNLKYIADNLENPTYNSLEVGFRHSPLTQKELIERYKQECYIARHDILKLTEIIAKEGIENGNC